MRAIIIAVIILITSCSPSLKTKMDSWVGHHRTELYSQWGEPDNDGDMLIIYFKDAKKDSQDMLIMYCFIVDQKGIIREWRILYREV